MSVKIIQSKFGLVLTCLLGQIMLLAAPVQAGVEGKSYDVNVQSSQGDNFTACFEFNANGSSLRSVGQDATYELNATYSRTNQGRDQRNWQAVTNPNSEESVALSGQVRGDLIPDRRISGNAINSKGTTYTFNGTLLSGEVCPEFLIQGEGQENPFFK
ncbi:MAG: hypothetical protein RMY64_14250 [Nostoc sp. DedQUE08]|uniref:hypothetical protein n=1 Tax=unclassified Nostoc TaxID=2593658 RepID=UPI002AD1FD66|nr:MULTISPECIES: hypothetical protein [unclassified Nostoc]MDZ8035702.1 hypothetical protein [Nostoc sp. DedSLP04]MDZ8066758.1 hypothetical protein [Nostoc sp. DedQUE08]MDZ8093424.1 hypothetical protein [Nostoc sp. DedQUE05]MDZ8129890.1 hypothetical protein [Nostoc sp. DedQUE07]MDZ8138585.1 hypothetical protein [Nostoc sp. DedQUE04]